jgi:hypothetical protein
VQPNNEGWSPGQRPPASVDPWQSSNQEQQSGETVSAEGYPQYSVPSADPGPTFNDYAPPQPDYGQPQQYDQGYDQQYAQPVSGYPVSGYPNQPISSHPAAGYQPQPPQMAPMGYPQPMPAQPFGPPLAPPPPPKKSSTGLIIGLVGGGIVLVLLVCVGAAFAAGKIGSDAAKSLPTYTVPTDGPYPTGDTNNPTGEATPSPSATIRDEATLDDSSTDETPFLLAQFFPEATFTGGGGETYTRSGTGFYSACENTGGAKMKALLQKNSCGSMAVGVYLNASKTIMTGVMVIPLPKAANATDVYNGIKADDTIPPEFWIWCPPAPEPGNAICTSADRDNAYRMWYYGNYHRYMVIAIALHTDGRAKADQAALTKTDQDCRAHVVDAMLQI